MFKTTDDAIACLSSKADGVINMWYSPREGKWAIEVPVGYIKSETLKGVIEKYIVEWGVRSHSWTRAEVKDLAKGVICAR